MGNEGGPAAPALELEGIGGIDATRFYLCRREGILSIICSRAKRKVQTSPGI